MEAVTQTEGQSKNANTTLGASQKLVLSSLKGT